MPTGGMFDSLFNFEEEAIPVPVVVATAALIAIFAIGIPFRLIVGF